MDFLTDLRSRLSLRSPLERSSDADHWHRLANCGEYLILEIDRAGLIQSSNPALSQLRDTEPGDEVGNSLLFLLHADDRPAFSERLRDAFAGKPGGSVLVRLLTTGDFSLSVRWTLFPVAVKESSITSVVCVGADLTSHLQSNGNREHAAKELTELRESLATLEKKNEQLERQLEEQVAAARRADDRGPIPGLEDLDGPAPTLAQVERRYITRILEHTRGRVSGKKGAAAILDLHPNTLRSRMEKYDIARRAG